MATMNRASNPLLFEPVHGASKEEGAILTRQGQNLLESFRRLEHLSHSHDSSDSDAIGRAARHFARASAGS